MRSALFGGFGRFVPGHGGIAPGVRTSRAGNTLTILWDNIPANLTASATYSWTKDGAAIAGQTGPTLDTGGSAGTYVGTATLSDSSSYSTPALVMASGPVIPSTDPLAMTSVTKVAVTSKVSSKEVALNFATPVLAGKSADGTWIVDTSAGDVTVTGITPASGADANGKIQYGSVMEPLGNNVDGDRRQGFDTLLGETGSAQTPYDAALNVDPGATGAPLVIAQGSTRCLVKALRKDGNTSGGNSMIEEYVKVVFMPQANTRVDMIAPGMSKPDAPVKTLADLNLGVLKSLPAPAGQPSLASVLAQDVPVWEPTGWAGDYWRGLAVQSQFSPSGYCAGLGRGRSALLYLLHSDALSGAEKQQAALRIAAHALDIDSAVQRGFAGSAGAGQWHGYHNFLFVGAFLLGDADMLARAKAVKSNMRDHPTWIGSDKVGYAAAFPSGSGQLKRYRRTYLPEDVGKPHWEDGQYNRGASIIARYATLSLPMGIIEHFPVLLLGAGPGGQTGLQAFLDGPSDTTNARAAALKLYDRLKGWKSFEWGFSMSAPFAMNFEGFFAAWRDQIPGWSWSGRPDDIDMWEAGHQSVVTAGDGAVSWDLTGLDFSGNDSIVDRELRYSMDAGMTWVASAGHGVTGTVNGLTKGAEHHVQIRLKNSHGTGPWSPNYPVAVTGYSQGEGPRNVVTTTGTQANAAPVAVRAPAIVYREYPSWGGSGWAEAPASPGATQLSLGGGLGYWSGFPAPTFTREWLLNGAVVAGSGDSNEFPPAISEGDTLQLRVTATNAAGSATATSSVITIPTIDPDPAYVIKTAFDTTFPMAYPAVAGSFGNDGRGTLTHLPYAVYGGQTGLVLHDPAGMTWSTTHMRVAMTPGTYSYKANVITNIGGTVPGNTRLAIGGAPVNNGADLDRSFAEHNIVNAGLDIETVQTFEGQFTVTTAGDVYVGLEIRSGTGTGNKIALSALEIKAV